MTASPTPSTRRSARHVVSAAVVVPILFACLSLVALLGSAQPVSAAGTGTVSGKVRGTDGAPIPDAHVLLREIARQGITDATGTYTISNVPVGNYSIAATAPCHNSSGGTVNVAGAAVKDLALPALQSDLFGHRCQRSSFAFATGQQVLPLTGDDASMLVALPFSFPFYDEARGLVGVSTNGYLTFSDDTRNRFNTSLSDPSAPPDSIFAFWDDLVVDSSAAVTTATIGTSPNRAFAIEWSNVALFGVAGSRITVQVQLFEDGRITMGWRDIDGSLREQGISATIGLRSRAADGVADNFEQSFDDLALVDGQRIQITSDNPPVARAGADQTVASGKVFTLDGSTSSDDQGANNLAFQWAQVAGPATTIQDPKKARATVAGQTGPKTLTYRLTVTDRSGRSNTDNVTVTVSPAPK